MMKRLAIVAGLFLWGLRERSQGLAHKKARDRRQQAFKLVFKVCDGV